MAAVLGAALAAVLMLTASASASPGSHAGEPEGFCLYCTSIDRTPGYCCTPTDEDEAAAGGWHGGRRPVRPDDPPNRGGELRRVGGVAALDGVVDHDAVVVVDDLGL